MKTCNVLTYKLIESYLSSIDTPRSLAIWLCFKEKEHDQLIAFEINPDSYLDSWSFRLDYLATKFLSKADFLSTSVDKKKKAIEKFIEAEQSCASVNKDSFKTSHKKLRQFDWLHNEARRQIERVLNSFSGDEWFDSSNWGPGVTLNRNVKRDTSSTNKFRFENGITRDLHDFVADLLGAAYPTWDLKNFDFSTGNKIVTVPKNSKTDRTIAIEPGLNLWFQKGIGSMIRRRLLRVGIDLNSQKRNQQLSKISSISGHLATIDFSAASDSISIKTVEALIPPRWYTIMNLSRSLYGSINGSQLKYEKFSSMGNGFTFELESLIFWSISMAVCKYLHIDTKEVSVYGDDVIIPVSAVNLFREMCGIYGFSVNEQKSFSSGHFRESCGDHYFAGISCKPYFLKEVILTIDDIYLAANSIRRVSHDPVLGYCDSRFLDSWKLLVSRVKRPCMIPDGYGDGGFIVNFDEATPSRARFGIEGYFTYARISHPIGYISEDHALLLARLKGGSAEISLRNETYLRNRTRMSRKRLFVRQWTNLGPWL